MSEFPFQKFIDLVAFDQTTNKLEKELSQLGQTAQKVQEEINQFTHELDSVKQRAIMSKKEVDAKELEMKILDAKQKEKERLLDRTTNQREVQSVYNEIENLKKAQHDLEEGLLAAWHALEVTTRDYEQKKQQITAIIQDLEHQTKTIYNQQEGIKIALKEQEQNRAAKEIGIPEEWLIKYAVMRRTVTNPVVPMLNGACSACFYSIPQQDQVRLRKHAMLQCKDCYRFLYME